MRRGVTASVVESIVSRLRRPMVNKQWSSAGYVLIPTAELASIQLRHLLSARDSSIAVLDESRVAVTVTGYTEWVGGWRDHTLSLGWDWGVVHGLIVVLNPTEIRTNIRLIAGDLHIEESTLARIHFLDWIETMPWRRALDDIVGSPPCNS